MAYLQRKNIRWANYDYTLPGYYFITIVTYKRKTILSKVEDGEIYLSIIGREINRCLREIHKKFITVRVDDFVIMPNHIHFIIENNGKESIAKVVRTIKALTSCQYTKQIKDNDAKLWQRNYFDRVIRNERELCFVRNYIFKNPQRWDKDKLNPEHNANCDCIMGTLSLMEIDVNFNPVDYFEEERDDNVPNSV